VLDPNANRHVRCGQRAAQINSIIMDCSSAWLRHQQLLQMLGDECIGTVRARPSRRKPSPREAIHARSAFYASPWPKVAIAARNATAKAMRASRFSFQEDFGSPTITA
jgi:hypothetical protein